MSNLTGTGPQVVAAGLFSDSSVKQHNLGEIVHTNDGRSYRYCRAGAVDLVAGNLQQSSAQDTGDHALAIAAAAVGDKAIVTTATVTVAENQYAGGFVTIADDAGEGIIYGISGHAAATAAVVTLNLSDEIQVALTTASTVDLIKNPYDSVVINPTTLTSAPAGVAVSALTATQYGWLQVAGAANVLSDGAITVGTDVVASDAVAGAVEIIADTAPELLSVIGTALVAGTDTEYTAINLKLI